MKTVEFIKIDDNIIEKLVRSKDLDLATPILASPEAIDPKKVKKLLSIDEKYQQLIKKQKDTFGDKFGDELILLGKQVSGDLPAKDGGLYREYQKGAIYWHPKIGAYVLYGHIWEKYKALGAEKSFLGYPTTDVLKGTGSGWYAVFEKGAILYTPNTEAHEVHGDIFSKYVELKAYAGYLGYPTTDEYQVPGSNIRRSIFEGGAIDWEAGKGAVEVKHFTELKALDWCYTLKTSSTSNKTITFYASKIANVGTLTVSNSHVSDPQKIKILLWLYTAPGLYAAWRGFSSNFELEPGETMFLDGITVLFDPQYVYYGLEYQFELDKSLPTMTVAVEFPQQHLKGEWIVNQSGKQCNFNG